MIDIENKDYDAALIKTSKLYIDDGQSSESEEVWAKIKNNLEVLINEKKEKDGV